MYARRQTPRLPEATQPTSGTLGSGAPLKVLFVGESTIAGVGTRDMKDALTGQTVRMLGEFRKVEYKIVGHNAIRIHELNEKLQGENLPIWNLIMVCIGANDTTKGRLRTYW